MRIRYFILVLIFFICLNVKAIDSCTTTEMARLRELANNVEFKYNYQIVENEDEINVQYNFQIANPNLDLKYFYISDYLDEMEEISPETIKDMSFMEDEKLTFYVYSYTDNLCTKRLLKTNSISLPVYNRYYYYHKDKCLEHQEFQYCKEFLDVSSLDDSEIDKLFNEYLNGETSNIISNIENSYLYLIGFSGLVIIVIIILLIIKKTKKRNKDI